MKVFSRMNVLDHVVFHLKWRTASFSLPSSLILVEHRHQRLHTSLADQVILSPHFCAKQKFPVLPLMISYQTVQWSLLISHLLQSAKKSKDLGYYFLCSPTPRNPPLSGCLLFYFHSNLSESPSFIIALKRNLVEPTPNKNFHHEQQTTDTEAKLGNNRDLLAALMTKSYCLLK